MEYIADIDTIWCVFPGQWTVIYREGATYPHQWRNRVGGFGYDRGQIDDITGMKRFTSTNREEMGTLYVATAQPLEALAVIHGSASYLFAALQSGFGHARATRLDVRVDAVDQGAAAHALAIELEAGRCEYSARKAYVYHGVQGDTGITNYFGSKQSDSFVRVYDKLAESHGVKPLTRVEVQLRHSKAEQAWSKLRKGQDEREWAPVIRSIVKAHISRFNLPILDAILDAGTPFQFKAEQNPEKDVKRWLLNQVLPTFVRDGINHGGQTPLFDWFAAQLSKRIHPA